MHVTDNTMIGWESSDTYEMGGWWEMDETRQWLISKIKNDYRNTTEKE